MSGQKGTCIDKTGGYNFGTVKHEGDFGDGQCLHPWVLKFCICRTRESYFDLPPKQCILAAWIRIWIRLRILRSISGKLRKTLISAVLWLFNDLLSLKTDVNVPTVYKKKAKKLRNCINMKATDEKSRMQNCNPVYGTKDPDPFHNVTDPEHCTFVN